MSAIYETRAISLICVSSLPLTIIEKPYSRMLLRYLVKNILLSFIAVFILPDCLVPYKHYEAEVITDVLDEVILPDDLDSEDYPSFSTMLRWLQWLRENLQRMEGYLRTAGYQILNLGEDFLFSSDSLLDKIRNRYQNWLERLLRLIYNSGGFLVPVRW